MARKWSAFLHTMERFIKFLPSLFPPSLFAGRGRGWGSKLPSFLSLSLFAGRGWGSKLPSFLPPSLFAGRGRGWGSRPLILFLIGLLFVLEIPPVLSQTPQSTVRIVREGKADYENGRYQQAIEKLNQAIKNFSASGDKLNQAVTLSNLSLAYQQLGEWEEAEKSITRGLEIIGFNVQKAKINEISAQNLKILAPSLDIYGNLWFKRSHPQRALNYWRLAGKVYQKLNHEKLNHEKLNIAPGLIQNQINQVQALQSLGLDRQARDTIELLQQNLETLPEPLKIQTLLSLGDILRATGDLKGSQTVLEQATNLTKDKSAIANKIWLSLGNTFYARGNLERDRNQQSPKNRITPWECTINQVPSEALPFYEQADEAYKKVAFNPSPNPSPSTARGMELNSSANSSPLTGRGMELNLSTKSSPLTGRGMELNSSANSSPLTGRGMELNLSPNPSPSTGRGIEFLVKAQLNRLNLLIDTTKFDSALETSRNIKLSNLPPSRTKVYAQINLARELACLRQQPRLANQVPSWQEIDNLLVDSVKVAENLGDKKAKSYAIGNRGSLYEYLAVENQNNLQNQNKLKNQNDLQNQNIKTNIDRNIQIAQKLTSEALLLAQPSEAPSIAYQWQWQLGRLSNLEGEKEKAVANYQAAVKTLELVRDDLLSINSDVQFSFRDNVEPVYRQLVNLLLTTSENTSLPQNNLTSAINLIDSLQLAELENFLRCNLSYLARNKQDITQSEQKAAFIYPIVLPDRLEILYKLPGKPFQYHNSPVTNTGVEKTAQKLRKAIAKRNSATAIKYSQIVYQWLIKPLETELEKNPAVETLVFVLDTELRNIPMAVLYDKKNKEYLVEKKYALSILPTSQLLNLRPTSEKLRILAGGISEALEVENLQFEAINAKDELANIAKLASTQSLLNQQFNQSNLQQQLQNQNFSVLHLATHGNFSSDPEQTYILAYNKLLRPNDINKLLNSGNPETSKRIELLVLSACQTANGDNRATLGLAGLAVRAGADSTLATLWKVNDEFTIKLIKKFYQELNAGVSKAEALHRAQKSLVYGQKYRNEPYDWGAYILVGNWL